jgi:hypothetical protein
MIASQSTSQNRNKFNWEKGEKKKERKIKEFWV